MKTDLLHRIFCKIPTIQTQRLKLRSMKKEDFNDMFEYASMPEVTKYLTWYEHPDKKYTRQYLEFVEEQYASGKFYDWAVVLKEEKKMIGTCGFTAFDLDNNSAEVGYVLNPYYWGNGYIPEALMAVLRFGFIELNLHRIEAKFIIGNNKSERVMQKCNMRREGVMQSAMFIKKEYKTIVTYAILSNEFISDMECEK